MPRTIKIYTDSMNTILRFDITQKIEYGDIFYGYKTKTYTRLDSNLFLRDSFDSFKDGKPSLGAEYYAIDNEFKNKDDYVVKEGLSKKQTIKNDDALEILQKAIKLKDTGKITHIAMLSENNTKETTLKNFSYIERLIEDSSRTFLDGSKYTAKAPPESKTKNVIISESVTALASKIENQKN